MLKRRCIGFHTTITILNPFKSLILYSTSAATSNSNNVPSMAEYLVDSLGFSQDEAASIVTKVTNRFKSIVSIATKVSRRYKSFQNPELVIDFLKKSGFDATQVRKVVSAYPFVLHNNVEKTLEPKFRAFQDLGFSGSDLCSVISQHPHMLNRSLARIAPTLDQLKSIIGSNDELIRFFLKTKSSKLFSMGYIKNLPQNMLLLQSYGVQREKIKQLIIQRPLLLIRNTHWFEKRVKLVEEKLGIHRTSCMFIHGFSSLSMTSEERLESWLRVFRSFGWSETEISTLLRRHPFALHLSEKLVTVKLKYFMEELGYGPDYLASHPALLTYSMEKRIVPRIVVIQALKEKELVRYNLNFYTVMCKAESKFVERYLMPFKGDLPQIYEYYRNFSSVSL